MINLRATSLRFRLMMLVILAMLPIFGLTIYHASREQDRKLRDLEEEALRLAELAAGGVGKVMEGTRQMLLFLAYAEPVRTMNAPAASALFAELLTQSKSCVNLGLTQPDGLIIASALPMAHPVSAAERPWFKQLQKTRDFSIGEFQVGQITGQPTLNVAFKLPKQSNNQPAAAVFAALNLQTLQECIVLPQLPPSAVILAVDRNGIELARNPGHDKWVGARSHSWAAL